MADLMRLIRELPNDNMTPRWVASRLAVGEADARVALEALCARGEMLRVTKAGVSGAEPSEGDRFLTTS